MPKPSKRDQLVEALLWEVGYEAMSPRDIQAPSAAKPGSLDHHFASKLAIAEVALGKVAAEAWSVAGTSHRFAALRCFGGYRRHSGRGKPRQQRFL